MGRFAAGKGLAGCCKLVDHGLEGCFGARERIARHPSFKFGGECRIGRPIGREGGIPLGFKALARGVGVPTGGNVGGDLEGRVVPANCFSGGLDFLDPQGFTVCLRSTRTARRTGADRCPAENNIGAMLFGSGEGNSGTHRIHIMAVDGSNDVPSISTESSSRVIAKPATDRAVNADPVVVIERDELVQLQHTGQRTGFVTDALHQATVAQKRVGVVIDDGVARLIELVAQKLLGQRHADCVRDALPERASCCFDANRHADFGVPGSFAVHLPEALEFADRQVITRQMQQRIKDHRGMTVGQYESIPIGPMGVGWVVPQVPIPERDGHFSHAHWSPWVARIGLLDGVHGERPDGVGERVSVLRASAQDALGGIRRH